MKQLKEIVANAKAENNLRVAVFVDAVDQAVNEHDDTLGILTAFRHAANSIGVEAGIVMNHKDHGGLSGDHYFLELIAEAELRFRKLSTGYELLRAASTVAAEEHSELLAEVEGAWEDLGQSDGKPRISPKLIALQKVLADDLS